jgi:hypothetical protein
MCLHRVCKRVAGFDVEDLGAVVAGHKLQPCPLLRRGRNRCQIQADALHARELVDVVLMLPRAVDQTPAAAEMQLGYDRRWGRPFEEPIEIDGRKLVTLRDAGEYITALPKKEHDAPAWRAAMEALLLVIERGGPTLFARIGIMRALNRHYVPEFNPKGKEPHWGRRKLKRVQ